MRHACSLPPPSFRAAAAPLGRHWPSLKYDDALLLPAEARPGADEALLALSGVAARDALCSGALSAASYAAALLRRARDTRCVNAWAAIDPLKVVSEAAAVDARFAAGADTRPLCGMPVAFKDVFDVVGYPTVSGPPALEGFYPPFSSDLVLRVQAAHGVVLGKLRNHEVQSGKRSLLDPFISRPTQLGGGDTTVNPVYGPTLNPHNVTHTGS